MPIIFASMVLFLPASIAQFFRGNEVLNQIIAYLSPGHWLYILVYLDS